MAITRTYTVGNSGGIRRLDNLTGPWIDIPLTFPGSSSLVLKDVETDPNDGDKVFAVGDGLASNNTFGIYFSTDAGVTWQIPGGNYQTNVDLVNALHWFEVWVLDSNNIFVAGQNGYVAKSTDGGLTFNLCTQLPPVPGCPACMPSIQNVYSVHFINASIGVVGTPQNVVGTIDGGTTWTILNGGSVLMPTSGDIMNIVGIHMSADQQTIVACGQGRMMQSLDAGATFNQVYDWSRYGLHLTWINDLELWGFGANNRIVKSTDGGATWSIVAPDLGGGPSHNAGHFYQGQNGFFSSNANIYSTSNGASTGTLSETSPYSVNAVWTWLAPLVCYRLVDCKGSQAPIITSLDLSAIVGQVVQVCINPCFPADCPCDPVEGCWTVEVSPTCQGALVFGQIEVTDTFDTCQECEPICYRLTDCLGQKPDIFTNMDLSQYVGQVVHLQNCPETCWSVQIAQECQDCIPIGAITESFLNCLACLPPPPPAPPLELNPRKIKPGYSTPGCSPEYTEKVNCAYMDVMYADMLSRRFGVATCCEEDMQKWWLKKQLLDLKALYDPTLCKSTLVDCCPPCNVTATIQIFNPTQCAPPTNVTAQIGPPTACAIPTGLQQPAIIIG